MLKRANTPRRPGPPQPKRCSIAAAFHTTGNPPKDPPKAELMYWLPPSRVEQSGKRRIPPSNWGAVDKSLGDELLTPEGASARSESRRDKMREASRKPKPWLPQNNPDPSWYSEYWLEDKPWPGLAFFIGRPMRRVSCRAISAVLAKTAILLNSVRDVGLLSSGRPAAPGARPTRNAKHPA